MVLPGSMNIAPPHHLDAVAPRGFHVDLVAQRLEAADHHRRGGPLPDAQGRRTMPGAHLVHQHVVQCHVQAGRLRRGVDQLPVVVTPFAAHHAASPSTARRTAIAIACAERPYIITSSASPCWMAVARAASSAFCGRPSSARLIACSALSGSRKKSPLTCTPASRPSRTSRSTTTSLPPGILYSPCMGAFRVSS